MNHLLAHFREFSRTSNWPDGHRLRVTSPAQDLHVQHVSPPWSSETSHRTAAARVCLHDQRISAETVSGKLARVLVVLIGVSTRLQSAIIADLSGQTFAQVTFRDIWHVGGGGVLLEDESQFSLFRTDGRQCVVSCGLSGLLMSVDGVGRGGGGVDAVGRRVLWAVNHRSRGPSWCHSSTISIWLICSIVHLLSPPRTTTGSTGNLYTQEFSVPTRAHHQSISLCNEPSKLCGSLKQSVRRFTWNWHGGGGRNSAWQGCDLELRYENGGVGSETMQRLGGWAKPSEGWAAGSMRWSIVSWTAAMREKNDGGGGRKCCQVCLGILLEKLAIEKMMRGVGRIPSKLQQSVFLKLLYFYFPVQQHLTIAHLNGWGWVCKFCFVFFSGCFFYWYLNCFSVYFLL